MSFQIQVSARAARIVGDCIEVDVKVSYGGQDRCGIVFMSRLPSRGFARWDFALKRAYVPDVVWVPPNAWIDKPLLDRLDDLNYETFWRVLEEIEATATTCCVAMDLASRSEEDWEAMAAARRRT